MTVEQPFVKEISCNSVVIVKGCHRAHFQPLYFAFVTWRYVAGGDSVVLALATVLPPFGDTDLIWWVMSILQGWVKQSSPSCIESRSCGEEKPVADSNGLTVGSARLALAIEGSGVGVWDHNVVTGGVYYSSSWKAMLGFSDAEIGGTVDEFYTRVHPDDLAYVQAAMQDQFDEKTDNYKAEFRLLCKDGSYKWISSRGKVVSRDGEGSAQRMVGTAIDITATRKASEELESTVKLLTSLIDEIPGLAFQYCQAPSGASYFPYVSSGIQSILGVTPEDVATSALALDKIIHPDDLFAYHDSFRESAERLRPWHCEFRVFLPGKGLCWRYGNARPQRLDDGSTLWCGFMTDVTARKNVEVELHQFATTDYLTQLPNRRVFMARIEMELDRLHHDRRKPAAILMVDLDHFKEINDYYGHANGDKALKHFAAVLSNHLREADVAGRVGGEEFAVMLPASGNIEALAFARHLQRHLEEAPLLDGDLHIKMSVSIGITIMDTGDVTAEEAIARSDKALYRAKNSGRNRIRVLLTGDRESQLDNW